MYTVLLYFYCNFNLWMVLIEYPVFFRALGATAITFEMELRIM